MIARELDKQNNKAA
ncbi:TPA: hypothetical protein IQM63_003187 [Escherichia coli]|nr:hypothetical protein [Escherichia coli]HAP0473395.1 hypothetical protein [Escherichia coli]